jgi:hypothetical protein
MNRTILDHGLEDFSPASQRLYSMATNNATWLKIDHTGHFTFTDWAWAVEMTSYSRQGSLAIDASLLWFFNKHLKADLSPFPALPEIIGLKMK